MDWVSKIVDWVGFDLIKQNGISYGAGLSYRGGIPLA